MTDHDYKLSVHHIGGRAGTMQFPKLPQIFERELERVLYDADEDCIEEIKERRQGTESKTVIIPRCLSDKKGKEDFFLHPDRYESSLTPLPAVKNGTHFAANTQFGWDLDLYEPDEVFDMDVTTLDDLFVDNPAQTDAAPPDFISLDVERSEPKVLRGAEKLLRDQFLIVQCEFGMQTTFHELLGIANEFNYYIGDVEIGPSHFKYSRQIPIGLRMVKGNSPAKGELLLFKDPRAITSHHGNPQRDMLKAAFFAFVLFKFEDMYRYIDEWKTLGDGNAFFEKNRGRHVYIDFMKAALTSIESYPPVVPLKFSTILPTSDHRSKRFTPTPRLENPSYLREKYFQDMDMQAFKHGIKQIFTENYIGLEVLCEQNGFKEHADLIKKERVNGVVKLLSWLDLLETNEDNRLALKNDFFDAT